MRLTHNHVAIAAAFMAHPRARRWGYSLHATTQIRSGVLYPALGRFLAAGWLTDGWEELDARAAGRPPRRYYRLTATGRTAMAAMLDQAADDARFRHLDLPNRDR